MYGTENRKKKFQSAAYSGRAKGGGGQPPRAHLYKGSIFINSVIFVYLAPGANPPVPPLAVYARF